MKKQFKASVLSLAVIAAVNVQAEECVSAGGSGQSLQEWGIWCGVEQFIGALSENDPTAAGPGGISRLPESRRYGRGDGGEFDPEIVVDEPEVEEPVVKDPVVIDPVVIGPVVEDEPEETPIVIEGQFTGYSYNEAYSGEYYDNGAISEETENEPEYESVGRFGLSLNDDADEGVADDSVSYWRYGNDGELLDQADIACCTEEGDVYEYADVDVNEGWLSAESEIYTEVDETPYDYEENFAYRGIEGFDAFSAEVMVDGEVVLLKYWLGTLFSESGNYYEDGIEESETWQGTQSLFLVGEETPLSDIQDLINGDIQATYLGSSNIGDMVEINVDFGEASFTSLVSNPGLSFEAAGVVDGASIHSTSVSGVDSGYFEGTFNGAKAAGLSGDYQYTIGDETTGAIYVSNRGEPVGG